MRWFKMTLIWWRNLFKEEICTYKLRNSSRKEWYKKLLKKSFCNHQVTKKYQKIKINKNTHKLILLSFKTTIIKKTRSQSLITNIKSKIFKETIVKMIQATKNNREPIPVDLKILHWQMGITTWIMLKMCSFHH